MTTAALKFLDSFEDAVGKTIAGIGHDGERLLIVLSDGTAVAMRSEGDCDGTSYIAVERLQPEALVTKGWRRAAKGAGLITSDEWKSLWDADKAAKEKQDRAMYEQLKSRFEPTGSV